MAYDGLTVYAVAYELNSLLIDGRIDKIYQPEKDEIIISVRSRKGNHKLLLSCSASHPRMQLTTTKKNNPEHPPMFCMLLRKHIGNGKVKAVRQIHFDRILELVIEAKNEMGDTCEKRLVIEIMGKHSNIILLDESDRILDSVKHVTPDISSVRLILPGQTYTLPPLTKLNPHELEDKNTIFKTLTSKSMDVFKGLYNTFNGLSPVISSEILHRCNIDSSMHCSEITESIFHNILHTLGHIMNELHNGNMQYAIYKDDKKVIDFSCIPMTHFEQYQKESYEDISTMLEAYYRGKDSYNRMKQKTYDLRKLLNNNLERCYKKKNMLVKQLKDTKNRDKFKLYGELITANMYAMKEGDKELMAVNYYSENSETLRIPLDVRMTPAENSQKYYKKYNKAKRTEEASILQLKQVDTEINYLESLFASLELAINEDDIQALRIELYEEGYAKKPRNKGNKKQKLTKPIPFVTSDGYKGFIGKNNKQNDQLTFKTAGPMDLWFHTKDIPGSHVILFSDNSEVPEDSIYEAAQLAAYYSKAKSSSTVPVDYTLRRHVKKPNGSKPGFVIYFQQKTLYATPDENIVKELIKE